MAARRWRWPATSISGATGPTPTGPRRASRSRRRTKRTAPRGGNSPIESLRPHFGSRVGRQLGLQHRKLRPPDTLAVRGIETAGDDEYSAGHGPDIRQFAEDHEAEDADPQELGVRERRQHGGVRVTKSEHNAPLP